MVELRGLVAPSLLRSPQLDDENTSRTEEVLRKIWCDSAALGAGLG